MGIHSFNHSDVERFFFAGSRPKKVGWDSARDIVKRKLDMLHYAKDTARGLGCDKLA